VSTSEQPENVPGAVARGLLDRLRFHPREVVALGILGLLILGGAGLAYVRARPAAAMAPAPVAALPQASETPAARMWVHVVGAVKHPGVYRFAEGARVFDAVRAAGGFVRGADRAAVNLARKLVDGEQVVVPKRGEAPPAAATGGGSAGQGAKVNINSAGARELEALPGIGQVLAERIVAYREQHGQFRSVRDLMKVSGIGPKKFESIEPYVTV